MERIIRQTINNATRYQNMSDFKQKGAEQIRHLIVSSLVSIEEFKFFLVKIFQEIVVDCVAEKMYSKILSFNSNQRENVIEEMAKRYIHFAELGYVFAFKNYLDRV